MFANSYQSGFISIFYSVGSNPLALWDKQVKNGHIRRIVDDEVKSLVLDISGSNVATTYITCPIKPRASLGIKLPFFVMIIKNMKKYFTFEIQILDDKEMHRRFRVSNFQSSTKVKPFCTTMPIGLSSGWNQVQFNLADFTKRAYGSTYVETMRVQVHANVRIRRLYFTDTLYTDEELPNEFKLFGPMSAQKKKEAEKKPSKEQVVKEEAKPPEEVPPPPTPVDTAVPEEVKSRAEVESKAGEEAEEATEEPIEGRPSEAGAPSVGAPSEGAPSEAGDEGVSADEEGGGGGMEEGAELISEGPAEDEMPAPEPTSETEGGVTEEGGEATEPTEEQAEGAPTPTEGGEEALTDTEAEEEGAEAPPPE
ncbi:unnamed protein product [Phyllotreta striolata]|uniref:CFA20 domain-containing protein n=1 Tax=Phyllotreta striolata TaxID=444603 RepID=A0A9N9TEY2_PHYSR|nr:unnamed protein product [Phyllotreta striolata]